MNNTYRVVELFCGCGGFSHGFARTGRFEIILGNDIKPAAMRTFEANHRKYGSPSGLLADITEDPTLEAIQDCLSERGVARGELDVLLGGPPCQGFSQMRRREEKKGGKIVRFGGYDKLDQDPRNRLVLRFLDIARILYPKFIVIENVPQLLRHGHNGQLGGLAQVIKDKLESEKYGYRVRVCKLNAADYGVPQLRERIFFVASRIAEPSMPPASHSNSSEQSLPPWVTVREAISDLPAPAPGPWDALGGLTLDKYQKEALSEFAMLMRSEAAFPWNHITRKYQKRIIELIQQMRPGETWDHASERMQRYYEGMISKRIRTGRSAEAVRDRLIAEGEIDSRFYRKYYWSAYTRLHWDKPALTITANANFLGSGRFTHPEENRGITMREAARLQSFEDDFRFLTGEGESTHNIGTGLDMIGEAVPPLLAEHFANHIARMLDETEGWKGHTMVRKPHGRAKTCSNKVATKRRG